MKNPVQKMLELLEQNPQLRQVRYYRSPKRVVKLTRRQKSRKTTEYILTVGKPNYRDRQFIRLCIRARQPFPINRLIKTYDS